MVLVMSSQGLLLVIQAVVVDVASAIVAVV